MGVLVLSSHLNINLFLLDCRVHRGSLWRLRDLFLFIGLAAFELNIVEALVVDLGSRLHLLPCLHDWMVPCDVIFI